MLIDEEIKKSERKKRMGEKSDKSAKTIRRPNRPLFVIMCF